jgi:hypothetical protein
MTYHEWIILVLISLFVPSLICNLITLADKYSDWKWNRKVAKMDKYNMGDFGTS